MKQTAEIKPAVITGSQHGFIKPPYQSASHTFSGLSRLGIPCGPCRDQSQGPFSPGHSAFDKAMVNQHRRLERLLLFYGDLLSNVIKMVWTARNWLKMLSPQFHHHCALRYARYANSCVFQQEADVDKSRKDWWAHLVPLVAGGFFLSQEFTHVWDIIFLSFHFVLKCYLD